MKLYLIVDCAFNRLHYPDKIALVTASPPIYAAHRRLNNLRTERFLKLKPLIDVPDPKQT